MELAMPPLLDAEPTPAKQSKIEQPSHQKRKKMELVLVFWSSEEESQTPPITKGGGTRSSPAPDKAHNAVPANPMGATRGGGGVQSNLPEFGINLAKKIYGQEDFVAFQRVDAKRNPEIVKETADTAARMGNQSMLVPNIVVALEVEMPRRFMEQDVSVSVGGDWGIYKYKDIPFALFRRKDEGAFTKKFAIDSAGNWWAGNIFAPNLDELGVFNNEPGKRADDHTNRFPFRVNATYGRVKQDGKMGVREVKNVVLAESPTFLQYGPGGMGPGVAKGRFDIYFLTIWMPDLEDFLLAEECTICGQTTTELADMFAVAPCRHVNVCAGCYKDMLAKKTVHAFKCAICRCERPKGAAGAAGFAK